MFNNEVLIRCSHYCECGKVYLEKLLGDYMVRLLDYGQPAKEPRCLNREAPSQLGKFTDYRVPRLQAPPTVFELP